MRKLKLEKETGHNSANEAIRPTSRKRLFYIVELAKGRRVAYKYPESEEEKRFNRNAMRTFRRKWGNDFKEFSYTRFNNRMQAITKAMQQRAARVAKPKR